MNTTVELLAAGTVQNRRTLMAESLRTSMKPADSSPLSFAQQRLWFLDRLEPNSPLYNVATVARLRGELDVAALERSLQAIVARHESLRTSFVCMEDNPVQVVNEKASLKLRILDVQSPNPKEAEVKRLIQEEVNRPFDLGAELLIRTTLLRVGRAEHLLIVTMHHIVSDEWSLKIFFNELAAFYEGFMKDKPALLAELPIQYADYAEWQREWLDGEVLEKQLEFWKEQLAGNPPITELTADRARGVEASFRGRSQSKVLGEEGQAGPGAVGLREAVKQVAERENATLFMLLLAALKALVYRYTGQEDIIIGTPIAGRNRFELEGLIGFFVNTLPLRTKLSGDLTFRKLLGRVREATLGAYANQDVPFDKLVEELHPERSLSHLPFTRIMFAVQNGALERMELPGVSVEFLEVESTTAKFDLTLVVQETSRGLIAKAEYNTDLFEDGTIGRLLEHFEILLQGIVAEPGRRLSELPLLAERELSKLLVEWNWTATDYPRDKCLAELFEEQAGRTPEAVAADFGQESLTYGELNGRANQLAHYLRRLEISPETPVGICVERSAEMLVGVLGTIKAGGAYVPLDASYPRERLAFMLEDTRTPVLLTQQRLLAQMPTGLAKVICLDADWGLIAQESPENPPIRNGPEDLAYVMYTSGSTGQPKGVAVPQRAVVRLVVNTNYIQLDATDRIAQVSNFSFDAATFEIWGALLNGGRLVGISSDVVLSPKDFARELRQRGITAIFLTSALFNQLASESPGAFETLHTVMAGGETLDPKWVRTVLKDRPPKRLVNGYGPTENTTFTCCHLIRKVPEDASNVPIGRPIANTQVYLLDAHLNPVPIGVPGELYAGGDGVARGYWNQPGLAAAKFIPNPFRRPSIATLSPSSAEPLWDGERGQSEHLYRTGDLARWLPDGTIEFLGRLDEQVKIRGFRIELGEIETILGRCEGVRECVAKVCGKKTENKRLVAYFVPSGAGKPNVSELRAFLKEKLPDYMVPSAFVAMESLPLTANGKVDRKALPEPDQERPEQDRKYAAPRDSVEVELAGIWEHVLGVHPIGIEDRFFDLGGHSLLAVRVMAQIERAFGKRLRLATIFQRPTIEQLAAVIRDETKEGGPKLATSLIGIQSKGARSPLFLVHGAGGGMFWGYGNLSRHLGLDQPVYGFKSRGLDGQEEFKTIEEMAREYITDLRVAQPEGPYYLGGYCFGGNVAYEMARQLRGQNQEVALLALMNCAPPNSRYTEVHFTPRWFGRFLRNLFYWAAYIKQWTPAQRREFFRWKWTRFKKRLLGWIGQAGQAQGEIEPLGEDIGDLVDLSSFSTEERALWETHIHALLNYHPQPYPGRVHLFRSPGHPLWCSFEPDYGWGELARAAVTVSIVPEVHEKILEEPCVGVLAAELEKLLGGKVADSASPEQGRVSISAKPPGAADSVTSEEPCRSGLEEKKPLSFAQQRLWFLNQLEPGEAVYHRLAAVRLKGALNSEALEKALNEIVRRHEALRTIFTTENRASCQVVQPPATVHVRRLELSKEVTDERSFLEFALKEMQRPFDFARDQLFRPVLARLEERDHVLLLIVHEIVADKDSLDIMFRELCVCYEAFSADKGSPLSEPPLQGSAFAVWQREQSRTGAWDKDLAFWRRHLAGAPGLLELPTDRPRPAKQSYRAASETRRLPKELAEELRTFSDREGIADSTILLAALTILLRRHTRQEDIIVGVPVANGGSARWKDLIENFENLIVLRTSISGDQTMRCLLKHVANTRAEAMEHEAPFERIVEELRPAADQSYHPVCQIQFTRQELRSVTVEASGLQMRLMEIEPGSSKFDLSFQIEESAEGMALRIVYATDLFDQRRIQRMAGHWENAIRAVLCEPERRVSDLSLLTPDEASRLARWNETHKTYAKEKTLVELFEEQVKRTPEAEALVCGEKRLSYRELYARAAEVAEHLRRLGVGKEALVGICLERSWEMVAGILGTLQAGGAYVPMDPAYPKERLAFMLEDAKVRVLLTQEKLRNGFPRTEAEVVCVEAIQSKVQNPKYKIQSAKAGDLAYVIYTSGSTGKPKGVALEHRNAVALVCWAKEVFTEDELSGVLASTSICFDLSVFELFVPLCWGGRVILAENALALPGLAAATEVKLVNTVPSAMRELLRVKGIPASVKVVNLAGEPLATSLVDEIYHETNVGKVYDLYGPTETTTYSTFALRKAGEPATIGRPLANEQVYLLDEYLQPAPIGVPGELYIGGAGVTRGYLNRPELTEERFVANPLSRPLIPTVSPADGRREEPGYLYRTGDLARWREDGNLEFLGRLDHQVKVRGFRIELGEIEAALKKCDGLSDAVVVTREDQPGAKRLVAYVVKMTKETRSSKGDDPAPTTSVPSPLAIGCEKGDAAPEDGRPPTDLSERVRRVLRQSLPEYMVPSAFVFLEALPLTPNGKVDRKALPAPEASAGNRMERVAPRTDVEVKIAGIWREVMGLKEVGVNENFFDLGGHSLLAIQVISRMREVFGIEVPLLSLFEAPTIEALAKALEANRWPAMELSGLRLERLPRAGNLPASFVQERYWFLEQLEPGTPAYHVPAAIRIKGKLEPETLERAFEEVISRHEALRTTLQQVDGNLTQVIAPSLRVKMAVTETQRQKGAESAKANELNKRREGDLGAEAAEAVKAEARRPFDLAQGPLVRSRLVRLEENDHVLVVVMHHTVADGWSLPILFRELAIFYDAFADGKEAPQLPKLSVQYVDYAQWQRHWMQGPVLEKKLAYWKEKLAGAPIAVDLPVDGEDSQVPKSKSEGWTTLQLPERLTGTVMKMRHAEGETPFMVLMAAMAITLWKWTGQKDLVIGTVVAGRDRREIENVIGCFVNFLPIRVKISGTESAQEVLQHMRNTILEAQTHQDCPFEKMVEVINPERRLNQNPIYNVGLVLQSTPRELFPSRSLEARAMPVPLEAPLLDLRLEAQPTASGLSLVCEYDPALFRERTAEELLASYEQVLEKLVGEPEASLAEFELTPALEAQAKTARQRAEKQTIAIAGTFTAEPVEESLRYWMKELGVPTAIEFAPYNQVFQQLLDPGSVLSRNERGLNVLLIRLEDWKRTQRTTNLPDGLSGDESLNRSIEEFISALRSAIARASASYLVCLCPPAEQELTEGTAKGSLLSPVETQSRETEMENKLAAELERLSGVYVLRSTEIQKWYPVSDYYDASGDELGHVPYTPMYFTALGTAVARKFHALRQPACKVIVLDCDQTLWSGVCGEDGPGGVGLEPARLSLQKFMRGQRESGKLLCVCSKNNEEDVLEVFKQRLEMPLRREHISAWRLNWRPKSENLRSLAEELGLGLESFVLIDDNPVECAEVEANCPEAMTLLLPEETELIAKFLEHCWIFDHLKVTGEDQKRAEMYRQNQQREQLREQSLSLVDFLAGLELKIRIEPLLPEQLPRVAQLTQRTNQFNFTTRRRNEAEIEAKLQIPDSTRQGRPSPLAPLRSRGRGQANSVEVGEATGAPAADALTVSVSDRFGDYGLAGVMIYERTEAALVVDTFLLSCRVLGRGVEYRMLARLGEIARERGLNWVDLHFTKSARNKPALDFLENIGAPFRQALNGGFLFRLPAGFAAEVAFHPNSGERGQESAEQAAIGSRGEGKAAASERQPFHSRAESAAARNVRAPFRKIALEATDALKIHERVEGSRASRKRAKGGYVAAHTEMEQNLCEIWEKLLHMEKVGVRDNFFELGGHSLLAVRLFAQLERMTGRKLPLVTLFQAPTIEQLARALCRGGAEASRSLLVPLQPRGEKPPLFLVHGAGGDVLWGYANLAAHMRVDQPIYGIKSRGQAGLAEFARLEEMAAYYLQEVRALQPLGPYCLGGYCFGGNVAYEMARQLERQGERVAMVALLDSAPSNAGYERAAWWQPAFGYRFARNFYYWLQDFGELQPEERRAFVGRKARALGRKMRRRLRPGSERMTVDVEEVVDPAKFPENELRLWQIHLQALVEHVDKSYGGPVTLFRTRGQPLFCSLEEDFCWSKLTLDRLRVRHIRGSHENIFMEPNVEFLARALEQCLGDALAAEPNK